nr:hypothetical protein [Pandoravirus aubagnensis]
MDCTQEYEKDSGNNIAATPASDHVAQHCDNRRSTPSASAAASSSAASSGNARKWYRCESRQLWLELRIMVMGLIVAAVVISFVSSTATMPASTPALQQTPSPTLAAARVAIDDQGSASPYSSAYQSCWCPCRGNDGKMVKGYIVAWGYRGRCVCSCPLEIPADQHFADAFSEKVGVACLILLLPVVVVLMCKYDFHM